MTAHVFDLQILKKKTKTNKLYSVKKWVSMKVKLPRSLKNQEQFQNCLNVCIVLLEV